MRLKIIKKIIIIIILAEKYKFLKSAKVRLDCSSAQITIIIKIRKIIIIMLGEKKNMNF